jgi:hypothetical protein
LTILTSSSGGRVLDRVLRKKLGIGHVVLTYNNESPSEICYSLFMDIMCRHDPFLILGPSRLEAYGLPIYQNSFD